MRLNLHHGDCLDVLRTLADASIDAIVTDPPYGLSFMGKRWDYDVPSVEVWAECLRVLKPGGHLLAFAGTRTQHRMACRIEDAGFEIRDLIAWVYGSGFPKSRNGEWGGTALKPALEPITMARKPIVGTVAANTLAYGTGALNIDGCRVDSGARPLRINDGAKDENGFGNKGSGIAQGETTTGRWPANLVHDGSEEVLAGFPDTTSGKAAEGGHKRAASLHDTSAGWGMRHEAGAGQLYGDAGSAARFFYCAKTSRSDRNDGCEAMEKRPSYMVENGSKTAGAANGERYERTTQHGNHHPTVKPTALMRWLCRLVTPPGGTVLDPFMGSGSTGRGALLEGFGFVGIEREAEYMDIAEARIGAVQAQRQAADALPAQSSLFDEALA